MPSQTHVSVPSGLAQWLVHQRYDPACLHPLSGDAGFRRYFRVTGSAPPVMAVYAPPETENTFRYLEVSTLLQAGGVRVPAVLAAERDKGYLLVEDCGDRLLLPTLTPASVGRYYGEAMALLLRLQQIAVPAKQLPVYDAQKLWDEMALFPIWCIRDLLDLPFGRYEQQMVEQVLDWLVDSAVSQPSVLVHRDFHSRNLMLSDDELITIDFQDAVVGPMTYDLVSLLKDCYVQWPPASVEAWALSYRRLCLEAGLPAGADDATFLRWFDLMGLQRHIKVLGVFARLWLRDGKSGYLNDLPLVFHYVQTVAARYPQSAELAEWLAVRVLPAFERQAWWRPLAGTVSA